jgi:hypothetical protein
MTFKGELHSCKRNLTFIFCVCGILQMLSVVRSIHTSS